MIITSASTAAAIESPRRQMLQRTRVNWDGLGLASTGRVGAPTVGVPVNLSADGLSVTLDFTFVPVGQWCFAAIALSDTQLARPAAPRGWATLADHPEGGPTGSGATRIMWFQRLKLPTDTTATFHWGTPCRAVAIPFTYPGLHKTTPIESIVWKPRHWDMDLTSVRFPTGSIYPTGDNRWAGMLAWSIGVHAGSGRSWNASPAMFERADSQTSAASGVNVGMQLADINTELTQKVAHWYVADASGVDAYGGTLGFCLVPEDVPDITELNDISGQVVNATTDGAIAGDLPDQVAVVEGQVARTLEIEMDRGDWENNAIQYYSEFSANSPLYGRLKKMRDIVHEVGIVTDQGIQYIPEFTGKTKSVVSDVAAGTVTMSSIDNSILVRKNVAPPMVVADNQSTCRPGLNATWLVSWTLSQNDIHVGMPPRDGIILWAPMHGSVTPFTYDSGLGLLKAGTGGSSGAIGTAGVGTYQAIIPFAEGPYCTAWVNDPNVGSFGQVTGHVGSNTNPIYDEFQRTTGRIQFVMRHQPRADFPSNPVGAVEVQTTDAKHRVRFEVSANNGDMQLKLVKDSVTPVTITAPTLKVPADGQWHHVGCFWSTLTNVVTFMVDGVTETNTWTWSVTVTTPPIKTWQFIIDLNKAAGIAEVQVTEGGTASDSWLEYKGSLAAAVVEQSTNSLDAYIPSADVVGSWDLLKQIATAELGACYFDAMGTFRYRAGRAYSANDSQTDQITVTSNQKIIDLQLTDDTEQVANVVTCPFQPVVFHQVTSDAEPLWASDEVILLKKGEKRAIPITIDGGFMAASLAASWRVTSDAAGATQIGTTQHKVQIVSPGVSVWGGNVAIWATPQDNNNFTLNLVNHNSKDVYLADTSGDNYMYIFADWVEFGEEVTPAAVRDEDSIDDFGEQVLEIPSNTLRQNIVQATAVAHRTLADCAFPVPQITSLQIMGDPRLEYMDKIRIQDIYGTKMDKSFWIKGVQSQWDGAGYSQTLNVVEARTILLWDQGVWGNDGWDDA